MAKYAITSQSKISESVMSHMRDILERRFAGDQIMVLDEGMTIQALDQPHLMVSFTKTVGDATISTTVSGFGDVDPEAFSQLAKTIAETEAAK